MCRDRDTEWMTCKGAQKNTDCLGESEDTKSLEKLNTRGQASRDKLQNLDQKGLQYRAHLRSALKNKLRKAALQPKQASRMNLGQKLTALDMVHQTKVRRVKHGN